MCDCQTNAVTADTEIAEAAANTVTAASSSLDSEQQ